MFEIVDDHVDYDDHDDNGRQRTPEQGYTISSPCEPDGSDELKCGSFKSSDNIQNKYGGHAQGVPQ